MGRAKFTKLNLNKNILVLLAILALLGASIFSCKSKKEAAQNEQIKVEQDEKSGFIIPNDTAKGIVLSPLQLYARVCGNCHMLHAPEEYSAQSWKHILDSMQQRAHINDANKASLYLMLTGDTLH